MKLGIPLPFSTSPPLSRSSSADQDQQAEAALSPATASPTSGNSPRSRGAAHCAALRGLASELAHASEASASTPASAPAPAVKQPRTATQITEGVDNFENHESRVRESGQLPRSMPGEGVPRTYVDDIFTGFDFEHEQLRDEVTLVDGKISAKGNKVKDTNDKDTEQPSNKTATHFINHFILEGDATKAVMVENYKSSKIKNFTATDVFFSQYAAASGSEEAFPANLPNRLPKIIVRDTVDGKAAKLAVFEIFNEKKWSEAFNSNGKLIDFPAEGQAKKIKLLKGDSNFEKAMATVNGKSTGHIVADFNTLKNTNHTIESITITRTSWMDGIKMEMHIGESATT